jgi:PilZ domain
LLPTDSSVLSLAFTGESLMSAPFHPSVPESSPATGLERRVAPRFPLNLTTSCRLNASSSDRALNVRVRNISVTGISLVVARVVESGDVLLIELRSVARNVTRPLKVHVVYCIEHPCGEMIVGGRFAEPLSSEELRIFIK